MKHLLFLGLCLSWISLARSQTNVSTIFAEPWPVVQSNFDTAAVNRWNARWKEVLEKAVRSIEGPHEVLITTRFPVQAQGSFSLHARPALTEKQSEKLERSLASVLLPEAQFIPQTALTWVRWNGPLPEDSLPFVPELPNTGSYERSLYEVASLEEKLGLIQHWAHDQVLPLLVSRCKAAPEEEKGVRSVGYTLERTLEDKTYEARTLCDSNNYYWRGVIEMPEKDQLLPVVKLMTHAALGELDQVNRYISVLRFFAAPGSLSTYFLEELNWRLDAFYIELNGLSEAAQRTLRNGYPDQAIEEYEALLDIYPASCAVWEAWCTVPWERLEEDALLQADRLRKTREALRASDPLYLAELPVESAEEAYRMYRLSQLEQLFADPANMQQDFLAYADIALDAGDPAFAAHVYWNLLRQFPQAGFEGRNPLREFLFCLHELGAEQVVNQFRPEIIQEAMLVGDERKAAMREHPVYRSYEN